MEQERHRGEPDDDEVPLLRLEEHLDGGAEDGAVHDGDEAKGHRLGLVSYGGVLAEEGEERGGEDEGRDEDGRGGGADNPGALEVDAHHVVLLGSEGLAAEGLGGAGHAQRNSADEPHEYGLYDRKGGELQRANMSDECLGNYYYPK